MRISPVHTVQAIGVDLDLSDKGLGIRSRRYTMLVDDGVVRCSNAAPHCCCCCLSGALQPCGSCSSSACLHVP